VATDTVLFQVAAFILAPLMLGVISKTKAVMAGRTGAPSLQPYFDIWKLLQKGAVYSTTTTWVFRAGPVVGLAAIATAMLLLPIGMADAPMAFNGDLLVFAGLLGLMRFFTVLAALDTGSSFEGMGASREVTLAAVAEVPLFLSLAAIALVSGSVSLSDMLGGGVASAWLSTSGPPLILVVSALFLVLLAENARIPVDDPNTHLELTMIHEVMVLDHSGPDFGFITYASALKLLAFSTLLLGLVLPVNTGSAAVDGVVFLAGVLMMAMLIGIIESSMARLRMMQVPQMLMGAGLMAVLAVVLVIIVRGYG
jgi:formate hydrogenlyase subunit 4